VGEISKQMTERKAAIAPIPVDVCRRICTGQVVTTLGDACKEVIDNALDAGATTVEIRLRSFGSESMEVIDNGCGIHSSDFEALCKAHATSKLTDLNDFNHLTTIGFRGEALNALCAISSVTVITRHVDEAVATRLIYDHNGCIQSRESCARPPGTTVIVSRLFETLPVRRKELQRTAKKQFCKLLTVVHSLALSRTDVRFCVSSILDGRQHQILSTPGGSASIKEVLISLFGARSDKNAVLDIVQRAPDNEVCSIYGLSAENSASTFAEIKLSGYISSCVHGQGRSTTDRQFIYFNKRPVQYPKLCRIVNEVYQQYNQGQYCMLVLLVDVPPESIDVNVAPDKRSVFYEKEKELFAVVRASLLATFEPCLGQIQSIEAPIMRFHQDSAERSTASTSSAVVEVSQSCTEDSVVNHAAIAEDESFHCEPFKVTIEDRLRIGPPTVVTFASTTPTHKDEISSHRKRPATGDSKRRDFGEEDVLKKRVAAKRLDQFSFTVVPHTRSGNTANLSREQNRSDFIGTSSTADSGASPSERGGELDGSTKEQRGIAREEETGVHASNRPPLSQLVESATRSEMFAVPAVVDSDAEAMFIEEGRNRATPTVAATSNRNRNQLRSSASVEESPDSASCTHDSEASRSSTVIRTQQTVSFKLANLVRRAHEIRSRKNATLLSERAAEDAVVQPTFTVVSQQAAEDDLGANVRKEDFAAMDVIGQFNKGFIITRLRGDLFIVDQHASDEKYNFERLQKEARIQSQLLINPRPLKIGAMEEAVLRDNIEIFNQNGFEFRFDGNGESEGRALLTSVPVLNSCQLGVSDIDEMLSVLADFPGTMYRPTKLRKLFASRACRKSVMIGMALSTPQMEKIVRHLGALHHPWNCPHGRPTFRRLCSLAAQPNLRNRSRNNETLTESSSAAN
uniref:Mismatch repair endonuclease PMS2 n=2 Tax=Parascaris univalens TaxID=6257 RepID=A0A915B1E2_PARUN